MAYTSLYRRYRPETFDDVIGQDHIVRTLKNQIATGTVGHAYVFTGTRGTGKTSVAKIFARAVNCASPVDYSPCGKCDVCRELALSGNFDVVEMDAASNNSVDQIRELTDKILFPPTVGKFKVYIIDEVHMLSKSAYNALLKTLEEPPAHVIFILATTEVHSIPATILSRCLRFDFRLVSSAKIAERIRYIFDDNGIKYEPEAVDMIASAGQGSVRDALSIADMCVSYSNENVTYESVLEVLGASDPARLVELADYIADGNVESALRSVADICDLGKSVPMLANDLATTFRNVLYMKSCKNAKETLSIPDATYELLKNLAAKYSTTKCMSIMKAMTSLEGEFKYSSQHRILFEATVVSCALGVSDGGGSDKIKELEAKVSQLERKIQQLSKSGFKGAPAITDAGQVWKAVASELENKGYKILALALINSDVREEGDVFTVSVSERATYDLMTEKTNRDLINSIFAGYSSCTLKIEEIKKIEEDKTIPYIKEMFGSFVEIK